MNTKTHEPINDGAYTIYVNGRYRGDDDIGRLMHDFFCSIPDEMYFKEMSERAKQFKESKKEDNEMNAAIERIIGEQLQKNPNPTGGLLKQIKDILMEQAREQAEQEAWAKVTEEVRAEGIEKGIAKEKRETARKMLAAGTFTTDQISEFSGLSVSEIEELSREQAR